MGSGAAEALAYLLSSTSSIKRVDVSWNKGIGEIGLVAILRALARGNASVTSLGLAGCTWGGGARGSLAALEEMLVHNKTLQRLDLEHSGLGEEGGARLLAALRLNVAVREVRLHSCGLEGETRKEIEREAGVHSDRDLQWFHCLEKDVARTNVGRLCAP
mmetsp:Transcript_62089/g.196328  ORF Transcript_62089/g.196328 Transcript_62089/m.196328 type:complete len:160 (+) Transcript_62089:458-937(+)